MFTVMKEMPNLRLGWYDRDHTIFIGEIYDRWTWGEAILMRQLASAAIEEQRHPVRTVFHFTTPVATTFPGGNPIGGIQKLLQIKTPSVSQVYFVSKDATVFSFFRKMMLIASMLADSDSVQKYVFTRDINEALTL